MYPITPATSVSHYLSEVFEKFGGIVHQAEDEIAAAGVAIGASYAGKVAFTITSGPGLALKTEFLGLAVMTEMPLVVVDVQRGGPSTGLPTKVEQSDLLAALFAQPGDAPHIVIAPATIEECFHVMITARRLAEAFRTVVMVLSDANLATGVQPFPRPDARRALAGRSRSISRRCPTGTKPYDVGSGDRAVAPRSCPGQPGGMYTAHRARRTTRGARWRTAPASISAARRCAAASSRCCRRLLDAAGRVRRRPTATCWSSAGAARRARSRKRWTARAPRGCAVSSLHLRFLSPLEPGLKEIFARFEQVMTVEINYSDEPGDPYITEENRRRGQLALAAARRDAGRRGLLDARARRAAAARRDPRTRSGGTPAATEAS